MGRSGPNRMNERVFSALGRLARVRLRRRARPQSAQVTADPAVLGESFATALSSMYSGAPQLGLDGVRHAIDEDTRISVEKGMLIYRLCRETGARRTLEIGCAYGFSTLYFLAALRSDATATHIAIDPFERSQWSGIGAQKVEEVKMSHAFTLIEQKSVIAIPRLISEGAHFDVVLVDGNHRFDDVLVDFTLAAFVCQDGGLLILDDLWMPSIRKAVSFIRQNRPDFEEIPGDPSGMSVFRRIGPDKRDWRHFREFE